MRTHFLSVLFFIGALVSVDFVLQYGFRAKWYTHTYGRINLGFMAVVALVFVNVLVNLVFKHYPGRDTVRYVLYFALVASLVVLDVFLHRQLLREKKTDDKTLDNAE